MTPITSLHRMLPKFLQVISPIPLIPRHLRLVPSQLYLYRFKGCYFVSKRLPASSLLFPMLKILILKKRIWNGVPDSFPFRINYLSDSEPPTALSRWVNIPSFPLLHYNCFSSLHTHRDWNVKSSLLRKLLTNQSHAVSLHTFLLCE